MNLIQKQADDFIVSELYEEDGHKEFIDKVRTELFEYKKDIYKIEFLQRVINQIKNRFDEHFENCKDPTNCILIKFYENTLFFLQEEREDIENNLLPSDLKRNDRLLLNKTLQKILDDLNELKLGQELTYNDLSEEFDELKNYYFLNKRNWKQLFQGKLTEMIAGGIISETLSKEIVKILSENYDKLLGT